MATILVVENDLAIAADVLVAGIYNQIGIGLLELSTPPSFDVTIQFLTHL